MMKYLVGVLLALAVNTAFAEGPLMQRYQQLQQNQSQTVDGTVIYNTGSTAVVVPNNQGVNGTAYGHRGAYGKGAGHRNVNGAQHRGNYGHKTSGKRERR